MQLLTAADPMNQTSAPGWQALLSPVLALSVACAHVAPPASGAVDGRILVLEPLWIPSAPTNSAQVTSAIFQRWSDLDVLEPVPLTRPLDPDCAESVGCLQRLGREAAANKVVVYRVGNLGPTTVVRVQVLDVASGSMEQTLQQILEDESTAAEDVVLTLTDELADLYAAPDPWYGRPWVWVTGAAALLAGTLTFVLLSDGEDEEPDLVVTPP
ncbi:MAG: hypothetical protein AAFU77_16450 [Myxococcota bacterium]